MPLTVIRVRKAAQHWEMGRKRFTFIRWREKFSGMNRCHDLMIYRGEQVFLPRGTVCV